MCCWLVHVFQKSTKSNQRNQDTKFYFCLKNKKITDKTVYPVLSRLGWKVVKKNKTWPLFTHRIWDSLVSFRQNPAKSVNMLFTVWPIKRWLSVFIAVTTAIKIKYIQLFKRMFKIEHHTSFISSGNNILFQKEILVLVF